MCPSPPPPLSADSSLAACSALSWLSSCRGLRCRWCQILNLAGHSVEAFVLPVLGLMFPGLIQRDSVSLPCPLFGQDPEECVARLSHFFETPNTTQRGAGIPVPSLCATGLCIKCQLFLSSPGGSSKKETLAPHLLLVWISHLSFQVREYCRYFLCVWRR